MSTRRMHNTEMKKLVRVFRGMPRPDLAKRRDTEAYQQTTRDAVKELPRRLRHSVLSMSTSPLCCSHKGLDHHLVKEIFDWVRHEFDGGIGKFIYPLLMHNKLTIPQEYNIRCLEPVLQMWRSDFKVEASAPPDRAPVDCGSKWKYQEDQCPACMLARVGSDDSVLRALYAGMIVRFNSEKLGWVDTPLSEVNGKKLDKPRSKRVRFVRYWVKACARGDYLLTEAAEMGLNLRRVHMEWKRTQRQRPSFYQSGQSSAAGSLVRPDLDNLFRDPPAQMDRPRTAVETERWLQPTPVYRPNPDPRSLNIRGYSGQSLGNNPSARHLRDSSESSRPLLDPEPNRSLSHRRDSDSDSDTTIRPSDSISQMPPRIAFRPSVFTQVSQCVAPLNIQKTPNLGRSNTHTPSLTRSQHPTILRAGQTDISVLGYPPRSKRHDSVLTAAERCSQPPRILSSVSGTFSVLSGSTINMEEDDMRPVFDPLETREERLSRIKRMLSPMPVPSEGSVYGGFGGEDRDPFEDVDEEEFSDGEEAYGGAEPAETGNSRANDSGRSRGSRKSEAGTNWEDLY